MCMCESLRVWMCATCMQEEGLDPLGQGLEMVVSHYIGAGH